MDDFEDESSVIHLQNPLQISLNCFEDDEGGRSKTIDCGAGSGMQMQVITSAAAARNVEGETADDSSDDGSNGSADAPKPTTPWKVLSSTPITTLKAANFGRVDV